MPSPTNPRISCQGGAPKHSLAVPEQVRAALERGERITLFCKRCDGYTIVKDGRPVDFVYDRSEIRWTSTSY